MGLFVMPGDGEPLPEKPQDLFDQFSQALMVRLHAM